MKIKDLVQSKFNVRKEYPEELVDDLADSITLDGLISKLVIRSREDGKYEVLAGWRRKLAIERVSGEDSELPDDWYIVKDVSDYDAIRLSVTENVQRLNLSALELAGAAHSLKGEGKGIKDKDVAKILWTTEARVKRLLKLEEHVEHLPSRAVADLSTPDELEPVFTDIHVDAMSRAGAFGMGDEIVREVCDMIMDNDIPASKVSSVVERIAHKDEPVSSSSENPEGSSEDSSKEEPMQDRYNGRVRYADNGALVVESKKETVALDLSYYDEYLKNDGQFAVYLNAKVKIKTIGED